MKPELRTFDIDIFWRKFRENMKEIKRQGKTSLKPR
jgi:hypothetical protein